MSVSISFHQRGHFTSTLFVRNTQMKSILSLAAVLSVLVGSLANAASVSVRQTPGTDAFAISLTGSESFDTIYFQALPNAGLQFTNMSNGNVSGAPRPAGDPFTYPNRLLTADPGDFEGGLALNQFGLVNGPTELSFTVAKLGGTIDTSNGLFLGNVNVPGPTPARGTARVQILAAGTTLQEIIAPIGIPEPATAGLGAMALLGLAAIRRRIA
jgi:hypothetical protein